MAGQAGFITITVSGGEQIKLRARQLATWGMSIESLEPAWTEVGEDLLGDFALNMIAGGGMFGRGSRWAPLAPSTIVEKARAGFGHQPIMWRTGELAESLAEKDAPANIFRAGADYLVVGTSLFYAPYHQDGTRKMPRRQLVGITWHRQSGILRRLNAFVQEMARRAGIAMQGGGGD